MAKDITEEFGENNTTTVQRRVLTGIFQNVDLKASIVSITEYRTGRITVELAPVRFIGGVTQLDIR